MSSSTVEVIRRMMGSGRIFGIAPVAGDLVNWAVYEQTQHPGGGPDPVWARVDGEVYESREVAIAAVLALPGR